MFALFAETQAFKAIEGIDLAEDFGTPALSFAEPALRELATVATNAMFARVDACFFFGRGKSRRRDFPVPLIEEAAVFGAGLVEHDQGGEGRPVMRTAAVGFRCNRRTLIRMLR